MEADNLVNDFRRVFDVIERAERNAEVLLPRAIPPVKEVGDILRIARHHPLELGDEIIRLADHAEIGLQVFRRRNRVGSEGKAAQHHLRVADRPHLLDGRMNILEREPALRRLGLRTQILVRLRRIRLPYRQGNGAGAVAAHKLRDAAQLLVAGQPQPVPAPHRQPGPPRQRRNLHKRIGIDRVARPVAQVDEQDVQRRIIGTRRMSMPRYHDVFEFVRAWQVQSARP